MGGKYGKQFRALSSESRKYTTGSPEYLVYQKKRDANLYIFKYNLHSANSPNWDRQTTGRYNHIWQGAKPPLQAATTLQ